MNSPKYMGICQKKAIGVNCEGKRIVMTIKSTKHASKPMKAAAKAYVKRSASVAKEVWGAILDGSCVGCEGQLPPYARGGCRCSL